MGWVKTIIVALITALLMPWARKNTTPTNRKVMIRSIGYSLYKKYQTSKIN
jgi:NADH:ubiquinone oxidoreductase subunit 6 (subunit J)